MSILSQFLCLRKYSYFCKIIRFGQRHKFKKNKWIILLISTFSPATCNLWRRKEVNLLFPHLPPPRPRSGVNLPIVGLSAAIFTWKERRDLDFATYVTPHLKKNPVFTTFSLLIVLHKNHRGFFGWGGGTEKMKRLNKSSVVLYMEGFSPNVSFLNVFLLNIIAQLFLFVLGDKCLMLF